MNHASIRSARVASSRVLLARQLSPAASGVTTGRDRQVIRVSTGRW